MSSNQTEDFNRAELHPAVPDANISGRSRTYQNAEPPYLSKEVRSPQQGCPSFNAGNLEDHTQASQQRTSNETQTQTYGITSRMVRTEMSRPNPEQHQKYDTLQDTAESRNQPAAAAHYDSQPYQYHSTSGIGAPQPYSPQPAVMAKRRIPFPSTPIPSKTEPHQSPPSQGQDIVYSSPIMREVGVQHSLVRSQRNASSYSPSPANTTLTPDRSTFRSPTPRLSPNSLQRELEETKERSENILTRLMETEQLLEEREAEITELRGRLAASRGGDFRQQGGSLDNSWEIEDLHRQLHEQGHALRAAQNGLAKAQSLADYQQRQAERYSNEYFQLKESQSRMQQQPEVKSAQMEEARKVTEFYMKKVDQLSRDNTNITQQNRKLTEELAAAQRTVQRQSGFGESTV